MSGPQIAMVALFALGGGFVLAKSGEPRTGNHSFTAWLIAAAIQFAILWWGGFFS